VTEKPYRIYRARGRRATARPTAGQLALSDDLQHAQAPPRATKGAAAARGGAVTSPDRRRPAHDGAAEERPLYRAGATGAAPDARGASRPRARRLHWWTIPLIVLVALLAGVAVYAIVGYRAFASGVAVANRHLDKSALAALTPDSGSILSHPTTILVLGVDRRTGEPARSDTIMLMRVDPRTHRIAQLSIPRDMLVDIPGNGQSKINAAYAWGGPALAVKTVRQFTGVPVNHIVILNMKKFPRLIDAVGGVDVYVPKTISSWYPGGRTVTFKRGINHMDGARAEEYVRMRKVDSDFFRMARQQQVVQALQKKITARSGLLRLPWTGDKLMRAVATDLSARQLIELAYLRWRTSPGKNVKFVMQGAPTYIGGIDYVVSDRAANLRMLRRFEGG
jgi:LCP family protein required for cell wall assembly